MTTSGATQGLRGNAPSYEYITNKKPIIYGSGATRTLVESESGSIVLFDRVPGVIFTLPAGTPGTNFTFVTSMACNTASIITNITTSTPVIIGNILLGAAGIAAGSTFVASSSDKFVRIDLNKTTTGGIQGGYITITALSTGTWFATGSAIGSGVMTTPFLTTSA